MATRLPKVLPEIIHFNQNAYVKGRTIFDAVRTIDDIMEFTERYQMNGLLVATDFQKAFDSINHDLMFKALSVFNFGPSLIRWIQIFYKNISSTVMNNDYTTAPFKILRGVRQGDHYPLIHIYFVWKSSLSIDVLIKIFMDYGGK